jgi:uncharacterized membrane protein YhaH (DUF805 family)
MRASRGETFQRLLVPSLAGLVWLFVFVMGLFGPKASGFVSADGDLALHLLLGDLMREAQWVLPVEPTTFMADTKPFIAHEWLSEVVFSMSHAALGLSGPLLIVAALVATAILVTLRRMRAIGVSPWPQVAILVPMMSVVNQHLVVRPHVFTWLMAILWYCQLERHREGEITWQRWLLVAGPMIVLWTNLHGGFLLAFFLLGLFALAALVDAVVEEKAGRGPAVASLKQLAGMGVCALLLSGINPFGFGLHLHLLEFINESEMLDNIAEFASPDFHGTGEKIFLGSGLSVFLLLILGRRRPASVEWILAFTLFAQSLVSLRNQPLFALLVAPLAARRLEQLLHEAKERDSISGRFSRIVLASSARVRDTDRRFGGAVTLSVATAGIVLWLYGQGPERLGFDAERQPVAALAYVAQNPEQFRGRMFNSYAWGGFISYHAYPEQKTFINGFNDNYGPELLNAYLRVANLTSEWKQVLDEHEIDWILFDTTSPLATMLGHDAGWTQIYSDPLATIFVRAAGAGRSQPTVRP